MSRSSVPGSVTDINEHRENKFLLPYFRIEEVQATITYKKLGRKTGKVLHVTCDRKDCKKSFLISRRIIKRSRLGTAPCPHCFKVSILPGGNYRGP